MMRYPIQPRGWTFVFAKTMSKNFGKYKSKIVSRKPSQKLLGHAKQSATDAVKTTSNKVIQKKADDTGHLIGNKISDRITKIKKKSQ